MKKWQKRVQIYREDLYKVIAERDAAIEREEAATRKLAEARADLNIAQQNRLLSEVANSRLQQVGGDRRPEGEQR
jgi:hypothetical protein